MNTINVTMITTLLLLVFCSAHGHAQTQASSDFDLYRHFHVLNPPPSPGGGTATQDLMFITKYVNTSGQPYAILTFGDTFVGGALYGNTMGWSDDFDLSDGFTFHYRQGTLGNPGMGMTPKSDTIHNPADPDATESQIWFGRSFVLGQDIYTYYNSYSHPHYSLGSGLAVIRGGIADINNIPEFERVPAFWQDSVTIRICEGSNPVVLCAQNSDCASGVCLNRRVGWIDGHPHVRTESDGNTYLYLFNQFSVQRVLFTTAAVENRAAYQTWTGSAWVAGGFPAHMWTGELAMRATLEWNPWMLNSQGVPGTYVSVYSPREAEGRTDSQLRYRTADDILGPWSAPSLFFVGESITDNKGEGAGDCYSPVHREFFNQDGGRTIYTFSSRSSSAPISLHQLTFDNVANTRKVGAVPELTPLGPSETRGLDQTTTVTRKGTTTVYLRDTSRYASNGALKRTYPNAYRWLKTDTDASNGLTFDGALKFKPLRTLPGEARAWITTAYAGLSTDYVGALFRTFDLNDTDLGMGFAYARGPRYGSFRRAGARLPTTGMLSNITQLLPLTELDYYVVINDEIDPSGLTYVANNTGSPMWTARDVAEGITDTARYRFATVPYPSTQPHLHHWVTSPGDATPLFDDAREPEIVKNPYTGGMVAIYTVANPPAGYSQVAMRTAPRLLGPWSEQIVLYTEANVTPSKSRLAHARYLPGFNSDGRMYFHVADYETSTVNLYEVDLDD